MCSSSGSGSLSISDVDNNLDLYKSSLRHYDIIYKIGKGSFSVVWLVVDKKKNFYVLKVNNTDSYNTSIKEIRFSTYLLQEPKHFNTLIEYFIENINNNKYVCSIWNLHYSDLDKVIRKNNCYNNGFSENIVKIIMNQLLKAVYYLHNKIKTIHGDIKTDNILIKGINNKNKFIIDKYLSLCNDNLTHSEIMDNVNINDINNMNISEDKINESINICLSDYGTVNRNEKYDTNSFGTIYYSPPEVLLKGPMSYPIDIWSIGCVFYELLTGKLLFDTSDDIIDDEETREHLLLIHDFCGKFPLNFLNTAKYSYKYFINNNLINYKYNKNNSFDILTQPLIKLSNYDKISNIIKNILKINPKYRYTIKDLCENKYFII